ncbi:MAG: PH domain-containing protein [Marmoricola sp.]
MAKIDVLLDHAKAHLDPGEQVLATVLGTYETKILGSDSVRTGVLIATPGRLLFYAKKLGGYDLESFAYDKIASFEQSKSLMGHSVSFYASGNKVQMKWINDLAAMQIFVETVKSKLDSAAHPAIPGTNVPQPMAAAPASTEEDILGKIRQLGELHKADILSDEEFTTKKAELLARL